MDAGTSCTAATTGQRIDANKEAKEGGTKLTKPTQADIEQMGEYYRLQQAGMTTKAIGERYGVTGDFVSSKIYRYKQHYLEQPREFQALDLGQPLTLEGDWMIVGDVHVPTTDYQLSRLMQDVAKKHLTNPRLIIAGDFFNMDSFSKYEPTVQAPSWQQERAAGKRLLSEWLDVFGQIVAIQGNHDRRMTKATAGAIDAEDIYHMITGDAKLVVSNWGWLTLNTCAGPYRVTHSRNYSVNALTVASELALKFQSNMVTFHEHHLGIGWDRFGRYVCVNGGGLFDYSQLAYCVLDDSKSPAMKPGFVMVKNGTPYLFGKAPFTDWARWI